MRALVADDDAISRRVLSTLLLRDGYEVVSVADGLAAWDVLSQPNAPSLALLDGQMPGCDGSELCRRIRDRVQEPYTYILLLTGRSGRADLVSGLDAGADDYLSKPFHASELRARVRAGRRILDLQVELVTAREEMRRVALHDSLTGALNRAGILAELEADIARLRRDGQPLAVAMVDLDHFKRINDTWGHAAGDDVLRESVRRMGGVLRPYDRLGRLGGEEFLVVLPGCDPDGARAVAERVRTSLAMEAVESGRYRVPVTASVGLASADAACTATTLLQRADKALYEAKAEGRNQVREAA
jgi:diguanylate cyclase (GGDEF)-like protein